MKIGKMIVGTSHRTPNSLSRKKFLARLNKGLSLFHAYGGQLNHIVKYENIRDLNVHTFANGDRSEFIHGTVIHPSCSSNQHMSLKDMNVVRNQYNQNFVFRTRWAAENYLKGQR